MLENISRAAVAATVVVLWGVLIASGFGPLVAPAPLSVGTIPAGTAAPARHGAAGPALANPPAGPVYPTPIHHVIVVVLENTEASSVLQGGSFESELAKTYAYATQSYGVCHPSEPNYLALTSGSPLHRCGTDAYANLTSWNIADGLETGGFSWGAFEESMPAPCDTNDSYPYAVRHDPFVFYHDIVQNTSRCDAHVENFTAWDADAASGHIPNYAFITPNVIDDGHDTQFSYADHWLKGWLTPLLNTSWFKSTAVFITYDEGLTNLGYNASGAHLYGGHVYTVVVSPYTLGQGDYTRKVSHYNLLTTIEWLFGIGSNGVYDNFVGFPPMYAMFSFAPAGMHLASALAPAVTMARRA